MRFSRNRREELVDGLLTLALLRLAMPEGPGSDRLKVAKLVFIPCLEMFEQRAKGFNFSFYRYTWGPFTKELYETWEDLEWAGLLEVGSGASGKITLTQQGHELAASFIEEVLDTPKNRPFLECLRSAAEKYGTLSTGALLKQVYSRPVTPIGFIKRVTVGATPIGLYFTAPWDEDVAVSSLDVPDVWLARADAHRQRAQAQTAGRPDIAEESILEELAQAVAADERGEGRRLTAQDVEEIKKRHGIS